LSLPTFNSEKGKGEKRPWFLRKDFKGFTLRDCEKKKKRKDDRRPIRPTKRKRGEGGHLLGGLAVFLQSVNWKGRGGKS